MNKNKRILYKMIQIITIKIMFNSMIKFNKNIYFNKIFKRTTKNLKKVKN